MYHSEFGRRLRSQSSGSSGAVPASPSLSSYRRSTDISGFVSPSSSRQRALPASSSSTSLARPRSDSIPHRVAPSSSASSLASSSSCVIGDEEDDMENPFLANTPSASSSRPTTPSSRTRVRRTRSGFLADRFIPQRDGSDMQALFQLKPNEASTPSRTKRKISAAEMDAQREEANETYNAVLSSELFGTDPSALAAAVGSKSSRSPGINASLTGRASSSRASTFGSVPSTPSKRNIFSYSSQSPTSMRSSRSNGTLTPGNNNSIPRSDSWSPSRRASSGLFGSSPSKLNVQDTLDSPSHSIYDSSPVSAESQRVLMSPRKTHRSLPKVPYKVLDAPDLADDFYLNLVDWSSKDVLGVGLANSVYLWSAKTSSVTRLCEVDREQDRITSVNWAGQGNYIAVGLQHGEVQIWDAEAVRLVRTMKGHSARVGSLAWNEHILSTGSRDRTILHRDVRVPEHSIFELKGHSQEICGLKWNTTTNQLASGGNDNKLFVWEGLGTNPLHRFRQHKAAVKAIAWSPHQNGLLASGAGTADMHIRFFNTLSGQLLSEVDTGSQVCNLAWSRVNNEIISTHGFSGAKVQNQVQVWKYPDMSQVATLMGHTMRVLYLAMSPDGESVVSGAGDETLRFWDLNTPGKPGILSNAWPSSSSTSLSSLSASHSSSSLLSSHLGPRSLHMKLR